MEQSARGRFSFLHVSPRSGPGGNRTHFQELKRLLLAIELQTHASRRRCLSLGAVTLTEDTTGEICFFAFDYSVFSEHVEGSCSCFCRGATRLSGSGRNRTFTAEAADLQSAEPTTCSTLPLCLQSERRESNPLFSLGKAVRDHYATLAFASRAPGENRTPVPGLRNQCPAIERQGRSSRSPRNRTLLRRLWRPPDAQHPRPIWLPIPSMSTSSQKLSPKTKRPGDFSRRPLVGSLGGIPSRGRLLPNRWAECRQRDCSAGPRARTNTSRRRGRRSASSRDAFYARWST
jgi:hypothetical protein